MEKRKFLLFFHVWMDRLFGVGNNYVNRNNENKFYK